MFKPRKIVKDTDPKLREKSLNVELPLSKEDEALLDEMMEYLENSQDDEKAKEFAQLDTKKEVADGVQTFNYQCNSMSTTNGQAPFLSVFMYLGETTEYKKELAMLIEEFLKQRKE